ncbi:MAG: hypothetical protein HY317_02385 [Acidobacteria bacterium]|nr:hypothetical protein [Acidobacteriota bacterium]
MGRTLCATVALLLAAAALAQDKGGPGRPGRGREELFKMVDAYIVSNLQEGLGLTDDQFVKVLPLVKKLQSDRRAFVQKRQGVLREMRLLLESGRATEPRIAELLRELKSLEIEEPGIVRKDVDALDALLAPVQQAKLRVLEARIEQKIRELMNRVRQERQAGRRRDAPPDDEP